MTTLATLATVLDAVYRYSLDARQDDHASRIFARDLAANTHSLGPVLNSLGGRACWVGRDPLGPDDPAWVVASLDDATELLRFDEATAAEVRGVPSADDFDLVDLFGTVVIRDRSRRD